MPRPRKNPEDRKSYHLRVPLTQAQHALIVEATAGESEGMAAWARSILMDAAKHKVAGRIVDKSEKKDA